MWIVALVLIGLMLSLSSRTAPVATAIVALVLIGLMLSLSASAAPVATAVYRVEAVIPQAKLLNAAAAPVRVIPAPGPGRAVIVLQSVYSYTFGTTAYSGGGGATSAGLYYGNNLQSSQMNADSGAGSIVTAPSSSILVAGTYPNGFDGAFDAASTFLDSPVVFFNQSVPWTGGDGFLHITVLYGIVDP
ncbi:MAG TPA: hypothetical protein VGR84_18850 [Candidatus Acidoferrales bacterium]|nr:hypothetical protein [Candidatus Acidoferrales bacterium]